ncbi:MAG: hypothetical protein R2873_35000 [Caldilineaceae bacterium]
MNLFNLPVAAFLSLVQMAITFVVMAVYGASRKRGRGCRWSYDRRASPSAGLRAGVSGLC